MHASPFAFDPAPSGPPTRPYRTGLQYFEAYSFYFDHPNWFVNLLLSAVCYIIPIVGPIVFLGYEFELILSKHRHSSQTYPEFDFGRFTEYLSRGVWPFLVQLVVGLVLAPVGMVIAFVFMIGMGVLSQGAHPAAPLIMFPVMFLVIACLQVAAMLVMTPLTLRAGLMRDFSKAFDMEFIKDFVQRMWWETILAMLFLIVSAWFLMILGLLACYVGMFPAIALIQFADAHLKWQLYELYLQRGGMPIPLAEDEVILANRA